jgi:formylmethanofuran dehydrogenase subunit E
MEESKMKIPSKAEWERNEFLDARKRQMANKPKQDDLPPGFTMNDLIIIEPDENEILCDTCNDLIETPTVHVVNFGRRAVCEMCYTKYFEHAPLEWSEEQ